MTNKLKIVKLIIGACVFMALFFAYQLPFGRLQYMFKACFLGLAILLVLLLFNFKSEAGKKWLNLLLIICLAITAYLYYFETE
jgi:TRAP-type uncharacterized transport system fused permease subunit